MKGWDQVYTWKIDFDTRKGSSFIKITEGKTGLEAMVR